MDEREINSDESFDLIVKMIHNVRTNIRAKINSSILLVWGYVSAFMAIVIFFIKTSPINFRYSSLLWLIIPFICYPLSVYLAKKEKVPEKTFLDRLINYITILFIFICGTIPFTTIGIEIPIFFIEGLLLSMWVIIIGLLVKCNSVIWGGIIGIILSHTLLLIDDPNFQILAFAIILTIVIIIPAHLFQSSISKK
ncbi:hypothetical protein SDC9_64939 [bioreactor metagenome]|uniref:Uncharacterized protein n=1 Tax=bioreactor metagenome TaxID=1076179 RepID=A0A644XRJ1_9ZZZZ